LCAGFPSIEVLLAELRLTRYTGVDQNPEHERYSVEFGPFLMAEVGAAEIRLKVGKGDNSESLLKMLRPKAGQPLHHAVEHDSGIEFMPYCLVDQPPFNCFPAVARNA
jgi:uncharacterized protein